MNNIFMWLSNPRVRSMLIFTIALFASLIIMRWDDALIFASIVTLAFYLRKYKKSKISEPSDF